jgi:hypothetical protein
MLQYIIFVLKQSIVMYEIKEKLFHEILNS